MDTNEEIILKAKAVVLSQIGTLNSHYERKFVKTPTNTGWHKVLRILSGEPPLCKNCKKAKKDHDELGGVRICSTVTYVADDAE